MNLLQAVPLLLRKRENELFDGAVEGGAAGRLQRVRPDTGDSQKRCSLFDSSMIVKEDGQEGFVLWREKVVGGRKKSGRRKQF